MASQQSILITGASMGIGEFLVREFSRSEVELILVARSEDKLQALCKEISSSCPCRYFSCDLSDPEAVSALAEKLSHLNKLDGIIHNAGVGLYGASETIQDYDERKLFEVNFFSILKLNRALLPLLKKSDAPKIMLVSSVVSWRAIPRLSAYSASKAALNSYVEALRIEVAPYNIRVINTYPGRTRTSFSANAKSTGWRPFSTDHRGMSAEQVAKKICRAYQHGKRDEYISWGNRLLIWGNFFFPKLIDWGLKKYFKSR